jgi:hypothetical protein
MAREIGRGTDRDISRARARARRTNERRRREFDDLDDPDLLDRPFPPGPAGPNRDRGADEGDEDGPAEDAPDPAADGLARRLALAEVIGSRPPVALLRLVLTNDGVRAEPTPQVPRALRGSGSLDELRAFVEERFRAGRRLLGEADWLLLLSGPPPATLLLLLTRLSIQGGDVVDVPGRARFLPRDRGLGRYAGKFALLPDGTPFSLRLLLEDGQGRNRTDRNAGERAFHSLPDAIQLQALRTALDEEARTGRADTDADLANRLRVALEGLGIVLDVRTTLLPRYVAGLRERLVYHGLPEVFPNRMQRRKSYEARSRRE